MEKKQKICDDIQKLQAENAELIETLKRVQADFENYQKRVERENEKFRQTASKEILAALLPINDSFEKAFQLEDRGTQFVEGMKLIYSQFKIILEQNGIKPIEALHNQFDPYKHEALMRTSDKDKEHNIVVEEFEKGYLYHDDVLRHTKVKVNIHKEEK